MKKIHLSVQDLSSVHDAAKILSDNLDKNFTIPQLAKMVKISIKKLKAGFRQEFNKGVNQFLRDCRFAKVKQMLLCNEALKVIAGDTGFRNEQELIRAFHNKFQVTPVQWRKDQQRKVNGEKDANVKKQSMPRNSGEPDISQY